MTSLPILRAEAAQAKAELQSAQMADRTPWSQMPSLKANAAAAARNLAVAEDAVKTEMAGLLEALGGLRWEAEQSDEWSKAGAFREVEDLVKDGLS